VVGDRRYAGGPGLVPAGSLPWDGPQHYLHTELSFR
jgi:hypothetical protein